MGLEVRRRSCVGTAARSRTRSTGSHTAFAARAPTCGSTPGSRTARIYPSTSIPPWRSTGRHWRGRRAARSPGAGGAPLPSDGPVLVARNVRHQLRNESGRPARMRTRVTPAGRLEEFLTESARAAREGLYNARNLPTGWRGATWLAEFALRFRDETVMTSPPPALQRLVLPLLAPFARRP